MTDRCPRIRACFPLTCILAWLALVLGPTAWAQDPLAGPPSLEPRVPDGTSLSADGTLLHNLRNGQPWRALDKGDAVSSRDLLLALPGMRAMLEPRPKSVELILWGNLPELSRSPVLESAVILHDSRAFDLDFTLVRGRVSLTNRRDKGSIRVWARLPGIAWQLTLNEPGSRVVLESNGRWPRGASFRKEAGRERPTQFVTVHVLAGDVGLKIGSHEYGLSGPTGPAYFHWDSIVGPAEGPQARAKLPPWADPKVKPADEAKLLDAVVRAYQKQLAGKSPDAALLALLANAGRTADLRGADLARLARKFAVLGLAALDDVPHVVEVLADSEQHPDARATAVVALRYWTGSSPGRDRRLFDLLIDRLGYRPAEAETFMQLLHSPFSADQVETYETLVAYLRHKRLAVRELAWWHLTRLVPKDLRVSYNPAGTEAERSKACAAWSKLIADEKLPPRPKK